jgi:hypothetical protein
MHGAYSRWSAPLIVLCMAFPMSACKAENGAFSGASGASPMRQLIIKFRPNTVQCSAPDINKFSAITGARIRFDRVVSGDACLVSQPAVANRSAGAELDLLKSLPAIEWVELDLPLKAQ